MLNIKNLKYIVFSFTLFFGFSKPTAAQILLNKEQNQFYSNHTFSQNLNAISFKNGAKIEIPSILKETQQKSLETNKYATFRNGFDRFRHGASQGSKIGAIAGLIFGFAVIDKDELAEVILSPMIIGGSTVIGMSVGAITGGLIGLARSGPKVNIPVQKKKLTKEQQKRILKKLDGI